MRDALALVHALALLAGAAAGVRRLPGSLGHKVAAGFLLVWGNLILTALGLGVVGRLGDIGWYAGVSCALSLATAALARWPRRRPVDAATVPRPEDDPPLRPDPVVLAAAAAVALALVASVVIAAFIYPNNPDTGAYRLPRAFLYLSQGHLGQPGQSIDFRILHYPLNGPLAYLFLAAYGLNGRSFTFPSVLCWSIAGLGVWLLARDIGASRKGALLAAAVYLLSPVVLVCSTSGNDEVIAATPLLLAVIFLHRWWYTRAWADALLAGLGAGISAGTKLHWVFFAGYAAAVLAALLWHLVRSRRALAFLRERWGHLALLGLLAAGLAVPFVVANKRGSGHALNPPVIMAGIRNSPFKPRVALINAEIYTAQLLLSPLPDFLVAGDRTWIERRYQQFNALCSRGFTWFDASDGYSAWGYSFRGVSSPDTGLRYSEFSLWLGLTPSLLVFAAGCLFRARGRRPALLAGWLALGFFCWHASNACLTRFVEGVGVYYAYPLTLAAAALGVLWDLGGRARFVRAAFLLVLASDLLVAINIYAFGPMRSITQVVRDHFRARAISMDPALVEVLRSARKVDIVYTEWELQMFHIMARNPRARYRALHPLQPSPPDVLRLHCFPRNTTCGFLAVRCPGQRASRLTWLGLTDGAYGPEDVFATGAGIHERRPGDVGFIALRLLPDSVSEGRWKGSVRCCGPVYGLGEGEAVEFRLEEVLLDGSGEVVADWQPPESLLARPWPIDRGAEGGALRIAVRSRDDHAVCGSAVFPLANDQLLNPRAVAPARPPGRSAAGNAGGSPAR
jgi:hypothetical protein